MPEHKIIIYANGGGTGGVSGSGVGGLSDNFRPFDLQGNQGGSDDGSGIGAPSGPMGAFKAGVSQAESFASSGFSSMINTGVALLAKSFPWVALAVVAVNTADKVISTGFNHLEEYTGHYEYAMDFNNIKTGLKNWINPVGYALSVAHRQNQFKKENTRLAFERQLVGNSILAEQKIGV